MALATDSAMVREAERAAVLAGGSALLPFRCDSCGRTLFEAAVDGAKATVRARVQCPRRQCPRHVKGNWQLFVVMA